MKIQLQILPHQTNAVNIINHIFHNVEFFNGEISQNPIFKINDKNLLNNIQEIQDGIFNKDSVISKKYRHTDNNNILGIDIKMETGTGKTYVYTRLLYELNKNYGFNKFIILVPSTPIKEGVKKFIDSDYAREHFSDLYSNIDLNLEVLNPQKNKKNGRKMFPSSISNFSRSTRLEKSKINVLLMTSGMLLSSSTMENSYDQTLFGSVTIPIDALRETKPVVIIDEPHRFKKDNKAYKKLIERINPQAIIRFGATFPKDEKRKVDDYNNLVYNLNAVKSFNDGLVKGVAIQTPSNIEQNTTKVKLIRVTSKKPKSAIFRNESTKKEYTISLGENLSEIVPEFRGITLEQIGKIDDFNISKGVEFSNGTTLSEGESIYTSIFSESYQDIMIKQALYNHFRIEKKNFYRDRKIKTLTLFFIDSIYSFRGEENDGYLKVKFENYLKVFLEKELRTLNNKLNPRDIEYRSFLEASLNDLSATNGGYFAIDNSTDDERIKEEIDAILRDKEKMLSFKTDDGNWNTRRFIFSKWTLREGWDNPNVFQIAKLRSSGSEISKLQEVGRGLRLPVDEYGNRISDEEFYLTYLIDFSEQNFAYNLISEINSDIQIQNVLSDNDLKQVAKKRNISVNELFKELLLKDYIDMDRKINENNLDEFYNLYPEFNIGLKPNKVISENSYKKNTVNIRKSNFEKLKDLWSKINQKYYIKLDEISDYELKMAIMDILNKDIYSKKQISIKEEKIQYNSGSILIKEEGINYYSMEDTMPYGTFLKKINKITNLSIVLLHQCLVEFNKYNKISDNYFTQQTLNNFVIEFQTWMHSAFLNRFNYKKLNVKIGETALTTYDGLPKENIIQGNIGVYRDDSKIVPDKFLFDSFVYDSELEKENIERSNISEVQVFGKIPRRSIKVPLYFGGSTSPDFMYVLKKENNAIEINLIIETKDVYKETDIRDEEKHRIASAKKFFETLKDDGINVTFKQQIKKDDIISMIQKITE